MTRKWIAVLGILGLTMSSQHASAAAIPPDEMQMARQWTAAKFEGKSLPGLDVRSSYVAVEKDGRNGRPLKVGAVVYARGLYCHAPSRIIVHLPEPGRTFTAVAGLDANGCRGSVAFTVSAAGREVYRSGNLTQGMSETIQASLDGARSFVLEVTDGGDGIDCDQADWAEARVTLNSGKSLWLSDLPFVGGPADSSPDAPFFSFLYGGQPSSDLLAGWDLKRASRALDTVRVEHTLTWTDPATRLVIRCVGIEYRDFPTVEWTLYFTNTGDRDTPILEDIQAFDQRFEHGRLASPYLLHHFKGSATSRNDYAPIHTPLEPGSDRKIGAGGGLAMSTDMAYFNLETPAGKGLIIAVGWPGQWLSRWTRDTGTGLRVRAGQERTHLTLHPGEEIRTPLIALQFWSGKDWVRAQNTWRRWMLAHNVPRPDGQIPRPQLLAYSGHQTNEMVNTDEAGQKRYIDRYFEEGIKLDTWWMDAGWYPCGNPRDWGNTGTWEVDRERFPNGIRAISDYAHARGLKTLLWFVPEMVAPGTWLMENRPEWVLGRGRPSLFDLGNPEAREWMAKHISRLLTEEGIDIYRQDMNFDPLPFWRARDAEDRQGITENRHIVGYLRFWDYLREHHPGMPIDSCASGGRRNDLESMRRAVPLWRTDYRCEPTGTQCATYGISFWLPLSGTGAADADSYVFRSNMAPFTNCMFDVPDRTLDYDLLRKLTGEWRRISPCYLGDYYPLTPYSDQDDAWMAWQFDRPDLGEGMVQAFRRGNSDIGAIGYQLRGLDPGATYTVTSADAPDTLTMTGRDLMGKYLLIEITSKPGAALYTYKKVP